MATKKGAITQRRTTIINRSHRPSFTESSRQSSFRMSFASQSFTEGMLPKMSQTAVEQVLQVKDKEKYEMQNLNERLASYIERVRFLQAQNKALLVDNERLKKQKGFDGAGIKELYQQELSECKKVIEELSAEKANFDAKLVGLEDKLEGEIRERVQAEKLNAELRAKIDHLSSQIGDYEGELTGLRGRIENLEEENKALRVTIDRLKDDNFRIRVDLDEETSKRICAENEKMSCIENYQFEINILEVEVEELRGLLNQDKGMEIRDIWKGELTKAINEIQMEYDRQLNTIRSDMEVRMEFQLKQMQAGVNQENMMLTKHKDENRNLKSRIDIISAKLQDLEAENFKLKAQLQIAIEERDQQKNEFEFEVRRLSDRNTELECQLEAIVEELRLLQSVKLSLVLEIDMYRKLLEGEGLSMKSILSHHTDLDIVQQESGQQKEAQIDVDQHSHKVTVHRTKRGSISVSEASYDGLYVTLENSKSEAKNMKGWKIVREGLKKGAVTEYIFGDYTLEGGKTVKIFCTGGKSEMAEGDLCAEFSSWGSGGATFRLFSEDGEEEKSNLTIKFSS